MLFPRPRQAEYHEGFYQVKGHYDEMDLLAFYQAIHDGNEDVAVKSAPLLEKEAYQLTIVEDGVTIAASCDEGLFRAATSLHQLIRRQQGKLTLAEIDDKPELGRRGYMLDISRGRMPKVETLKTLIDFMAGLKYNELQLYMEGDCFKYAAYPQCTADFDCLTPEDIRMLDAYCRERFIDLVPNQNSFGHMYTWLKKPEFRHLGLFGGDETPSTLNPLLDESYEFMCNLYESLLPHFSSEFVNIGLDEAYGLGKYQIEEYCNERGKDIVFMEWLNKLNDHISEKYGKKVMFWADMIYNYPQSYHLVPKDAIAMEWGYELIQSQRMTDHCIAYRNAGVKYYVCPATNVHGTFTGRMDVTTFNIRTCAELAVEYGAMGMLLTDWGDGGHPQFSVWSWAPIALAGQYGWNTGAKQDGETFKADFIRNAERYVDEEIFGGKKVANLLYRMGNYYLLEPERVHVCTMSAKEFSLPMNVTKYAHLFDIKDSGDVFYFNNVLDYVRRVWADIDKVDIDPQIKREINVNVQMVIAGAEMCKIKIGEEPTAEKLDELIALLDWIEQEYITLWNLRNYERGQEKFLDTIRQRRDELKAMKK
ncbi:MAG: family 20 glycosylhydrolase [Clostridia bacterium]|nr:family 20 glycosylhydrolase [Clostridia bacterium]